MAKKTSVHICPIKGGCEAHNTRSKDLSYVRHDLTEKNESYYGVERNISEELAAIRANYRAAHGKKMHAKATPIREAVVVIQEDTTIQQLRNACKQCEEKYGIVAMQIHTHRDEGHIDKDGVWKANLHAHIVFRWYDYEHSTTRKLSRQDMADMQSIFATNLEMQRGASSRKKHLSAIQEKIKAERKKLKELVSSVEQKNDAERQKSKELQAAKQQLSSIEEQVKAEKQKLEELQAAVQKLAPIKEANDTAKSYKEEADEAIERLDDALIKCEKLTKQRDLFEEKYKKFHRVLVEIITYMPPDLIKALHLSEMFDNWEKIMEYRQNRIKKRNALDAQKKPRGQHL